MANVTLQYNMYVVTGHRRQPRNTNSILTLLSIPPFTRTDFSLPAINLLSYSQPDGTSGLAKFIFWSINEGTRGEVYPPQSINVANGTDDLTITAWYVPVNGVPGTGTYIIDDAFSTTLGRFVDDDFIDNVIPDGTLKSDANVYGVVPTSNNEQLVAKSNISTTGEPFRMWLLNGVFMPIGTLTLDIFHGSTGLAIAVYQRPDGIKPCIPKVKPICPPVIKPICPPAIKPKCPPLIRECVLKLGPPHCRLDIIPCKAEIRAGCKARIGIGCPNIDPVPVERIDEIIREIGVSDINELAAKQDTPRFKKLIAGLKPADQKILKLMLKQIK